MQKSVSRMTETVQLRNKPELKIILDVNEFSIFDASEPNNNGTYSYSELKNVELNAERTNWLVSALSIQVDFVTGSAVGGKFKEKANLNLEMKERNLKIWLIDADFEKAQSVTKFMNDKKPKP